MAPNRPSASSADPHLTELLVDAGAGSRIVATDDASDYPPQVRALPHVANYRSINVEALLAQKPDLVVAWRSAQSRMLAPIEQLGILVFYSTHRLCLPGPGDACPGRATGVAAECQCLG